MQTPRAPSGPALTTPWPVPGALEITLEPQSCFNSEVYAADLGLDCGAEADLRVNLGERLLHTLFRDWAEAQGRPPAADDPPPLPFRALEEVPLLVTEGAAVLLRTSAAKLTRAEPNAVPPWVSQAVLHSQWAPKEPLKLSFFLAPHPSDDLPALAAGSNKLSAPKVLRMHKVAAYVANRLPNVDDPAALEQRLELLCNDKPLPMGMSLASVRAFCAHEWRLPTLYFLRPVLLSRTVLYLLCTMYLLCYRCAPSCGRMARRTSWCTTAASASRSRRERGQGAVAGSGGRVLIWARARVARGWHWGAHGASAVPAAARRL